MQRKNITITITAGTPVNVGQSWDKQTTVTTAVARSTPPIQCQRLAITVLAASSGGIVYVMDGTAYNTVPAATTSANLSAQLSPGTATAPGGSYSDFDPAAGIDLNGLWIDGAHSGDTVAVTFVPKF